MGFDIDQDIVFASLSVLAVATLVPALLFDSWLNHDVDLLPMGFRPKGQTRPTYAHYGRDLPTRWPRPLGWVQYAVIRNMERHAYGWRTAVFRGKVLGGLFAASAALMNLVHVLLE